MKTLQDFFLFCSGADKETLDKCPSDKHKYAGIGATILFTGILAFFSSGYALYTVFESYWAAVFFGLIWGLMIFNLDRYIVMSMKSRGRWWQDLLVALPRMAMAVLLALVISKPLEMKIFEKEIEGELVQMEQEVYKQQEDKVKARFAGEIENRRSQIADLQEDIDKQSALRDTLAIMALREADGTGGSGIRNMGPIYRAKKADADKAQADLDALTASALPLIAQKTAEISALESRQHTEIAALNRSRINGLAARMDALSRLSGRSYAIFLASLFITLLFVSIETAPIFVKLISSRSPYDYLLHQHEHVFEMAHQEATTVLANKVANTLAFDAEVGAHEVNARIKAEKAAIDRKYGISPAG